ncbi:MAG: hypothetical protein ACRCS3_03620 [Paracoccaceae bacterium]
MNLVARLLMIVLVSVALPATAEVRLASDTEVHAIGVYEGAVRTGDVLHGPEVNITIDRPGMNVTLMLGSYESVRWKLAVLPGTRVTQIFVHGHGAKLSEVWVDNARRGDVSLVELPYAYAPEGEGFRAIVDAVQGLTGQVGLTSFSGAYAPGETPFVINGQSAQPPQLQPDYLGAQLVDADQIPEAFRPMIAGLARAEGQSTPQQPAIRFTDQGFEVAVVGQAENVTYPVTLDVPTISWPVAAARDTNSGKLYGVSLGGEGYLYSFDPETGRWAVESSMREADASGMIYDVENDRLVITITGMIAPNGTALLFYGPDGMKAKTPFNLRDFPGLTDLYDPGNGPSPGLTPLAIADNQLLVVTGGGMFHRGARAGRPQMPYRAYMIDMTSGAVSLVGFDGSEPDAPEPW